MRVKLLFALLLAAICVAGCNGKIDTQLWWRTEILEGSTPIESAISSNRTRVNVLAIGSVYWMRVFVVDAHGQPQVAAATAVYQNGGKPVIAVANSARQMVRCVDSAAQEPFWSSVSVEVIGEMTACQRLLPRRNTLFDQDSAVIRETLMANDRASVPVIAGQSTLEMRIGDHSSPIFYKGSWFLPVYTGRHSGITEFSVNSRIASEADDPLEDSELTSGLSNSNVAVTDRPQFNQQYAEDQITTLGAAAVPASQPVVGIEHQSVVGASVGYLRVSAWLNRTLSSDMQSSAYSVQCPEVVPASCFYVPSNDTTASGANATVQYLLSPPIDGTMTPPGFDQGANAAADNLATVSGGFYTYFEPKFNALGVSVMVPTVSSDKDGVVSGGGGGGGIIAMGGEGYGSGGLGIEPLQFTLTDMHLSGAVNVSVIAPSDKQVYTRAFLRPSDGDFPSNASMRSNVTQMGVSFDLFDTVTPWEVDLEAVAASVRNSQFAGAVSVSGAQCRSHQGGFGGVNGARFPSTSEPAVLCDCRWKWPLWLDIHMPMSVFQNFSTRADGMPAAGAEAQDGVFLQYSCARSDVACGPNVASSVDDSRAYFRHDRNASTIVMGGTSLQYPDGGRLGVRQVVMLRSRVVMATSLGVVQMRPRLKHSGGEGGLGYPDLMDLAMDRNVVARLSVLWGQSLRDGVEPAVHSATLDESVEWSFLLGECVTVLRAVSDASDSYPEVQDLVFAATANPLRVYFSSAYRPISRLEAAFGYTSVSRSASSDSASELIFRSAGLPYHANIDSVSSSSRSLDVGYFDVRYAQSVANSSANSVEYANFSGVDTSYVSYRVDGVSATPSYVAWQNSRFIEMIHDDGSDDGVGTQYATSTSDFATTGVFTAPDGGGVRRGSLYDLYSGWGHSRDSLSAVNNGTSVTSHDNWRTTAVAVDMEVSLLRPHTALVLVDTEYGLGRFPTAPPSPPSWATSYPSAAILSASELSALTDKDLDALTPENEWLSSSRYVLYRFDMISAQYAREFAFPRYVYTSVRCVPCLDTPVLRSVFSEGSAHVLTSMFCHDCPIDATESVPEGVYAGSQPFTSYQSAQNLHTAVNVSGAAAHQRLSSRGTSRRSGSRMHDTRRLPALFQRRGLRLPENGAAVRVSLSGMVSAKDRAVGYLVAYGNVVVVSSTAGHFWTTVHICASSPLMLSTYETQPPDSVSVPSQEKEYPFGRVYAVRNGALLSPVTDPLDLVVTSLHISPSGVVVFMQSDQSLWMFRLADVSRMGALETPVVPLVQPRAWNSRRVNQTGSAAGSQAQSDNAIAHRTLISGGGEFGCFESSVLNSSLLAVGSASQRVASEFRQGDSEGGYAQRGSVAMWRSDNLFQSVIPDALARHQPLTSPHFGVGHVESPSVACPYERVLFELPGGITHSRATRTALPATVQNDGTDAFLSHTLPENLYLDMDESYTFRVYVLPSQSDQTPQSGPLTSRTLEYSCTTPSRRFVDDGLDAGSEVQISVRSAANAANTRVFPTSTRRVLATAFKEQEARASASHVRDTSTTPPAGSGATVNDGSWIPSGGCRVQSSSTFTSGTQFVDTTTQHTAAVDLMGVEVVGERYIDHSIAVRVQYATAGDVDVWLGRARPTQSHNHQTPAASPNTNEALSSLQRASALLRAFRSKNRTDETQYSLRPVYVYTIRLFDRGSRPLSQDFPYANTLDAPSAVRLVFRHGGDGLCRNFAVPVTRPGQRVPAESPYQFDANIPFLGSGSKLLSRHSWVDAPVFDLESARYYEMPVGFQSAASLGLGGYATRTHVACPAGETLLFEAELSKNGLEECVRDPEYDVPCFSFAWEFSPVLSVYDEVIGKLRPMNHPVVWRLIGAGRDLEDIQLFTQDDSDSYNQGTATIWTNFDALTTEEGDPLREIVLPGSEMSWVCKMGSPCFTVVPRNGETPSYHFMVQVSTAAPASTDSFCRLDTVFVVKLNGIPMDYVSGILYAGIVVAIMVGVTLILGVLCCCKKYQTFRRDIDRAFQVREEHKQQLTREAQAEPTEIDDESYSDDEDMNTDRATRVANNPTRLGYILLPSDAVRDAVFHNAQASGGSRRSQHSRPQSERTSLDLRRSVPGSSSHSLVEEPLADEMADYS